MLEAWGEIEPSKKSEWKFCVRSLVPSFYLAPALIRPSIFSQTFQSDPQNLNQESYRRAPNSIEKVTVRSQSNVNLFKFYQSLLLSSSSTLKIRSLSSLATNAFPSQTPPFLSDFSLDPRHSFFHNLRPAASILSVLFLTISTFPLSHSLPEAASRFLSDPPLSLM